jgi:multisubunit Na+/H+ antiporter MnhB subunit
MELTISILLGFMIIGAIFAIHAKDLLSAVITVGIVGYSLVICFLLLKAPDLAIVQIVVETITLIIMIAVILNSTHKELKVKIDTQQIINISLAFIFMLVLIFFFVQVIEPLDPFGKHSLRMASAYIGETAAKTGSANLVTGILFDFRGYDTLGEATILFTAAIGVLTILRIKGKK